MQMRTICWSIILGTLALATAAHADPVVSIGHYYVAKNSSQSAVLSVTDTASPAADDIEGMTFSLQIGAGTGSAPAISSVDFLTSSIWTGHVAAANIINPPTANGSQFKSFTLITNSAGEFVNANGTLATLGFNAAGAAPGDYPFELIGTVDPANDTHFVSGVGNTLAATIGTGTLTVVAPGDFNRDGHVTSTDILAMETALTDLNAYKTTNSLDNAGLVAIGDLSGDHAVTNADLQSLVTLLKSGGGSLAAVPEPASWLLMSLAALGGLMLFRRRNSAPVRPFRKRIPSAGRSG
jgi:PEP-CTERM motif